MNPLSLDAINASSPYFVSLSKGEYVFQTQSGAIYNISFDEDMEIAGSVSYQFSIFILLSLFPSAIQDWLKSVQNLILYQLI